MIASITSIFENRYFRIFFAAWTGYYLWQVIRGDEGPQLSDFLWMIVGFIIAVVVLGHTVKQGSSA